MNSRGRTAGAGFALEVCGAAWFGPAGCVLAARFRSVLASAVSGMLGASGPLQQAKGAAVGGKARALARLARVPCHPRVPFGLLQRAAGA